MFKLQSSVGPLYYILYVSSQPVEDRSKNTSEDMQTFGILPVHANIKRKVYQKKNIV